MKQEDIEKIVSALSNMTTPKEPPHLDPADNRKEMRHLAEMSHVLLAEFPELAPDDRSIVLGFAFVNSIAAWTKAGCEDLFTVEDPQFKNLLRREFVSCICDSVKSKSEILAQMWRAMYLMGDFK